MLTGDLDENRMSDRMGIIIIAGGCIIVLLLFLGLRESHWGQEESELGYEIIEWEAEKHGGKIREMAKQSIADDGILTRQEYREIKDAVDRLEIDRIKHRILVQ